MSCSRKTHSIEQTSFTRWLPSGIHFSDESTGAMRSKCLAQGKNILMQPEFEPPIAVFRIRNLPHMANTLLILSVMPCGNSVSRNCSPHKYCLLELTQKLCIFLSNAKVLVVSSLFEIFVCCQQYCLLVVLFQCLVSCRKVTLALNKRKKSFGRFSKVFLVLNLPKLFFSLILNFGSHFAKKKKSSLFNIIVSSHIGKISLSSSCSLSIQKLFIVVTLF